MQIHTDKLTLADLHLELPVGCYLDVATRGSRSRARRFDVAISADPGTDARGIKRAYARNSGQYGAEPGGDRAATWIEWGDWVVSLFKIDPGARIGIYESPADFIRITRDHAPHRPEREDAKTRAARWARELLTCPDCGEPTLALHADGSRTCGRCFMESARELGVIA